MGGLIEKIFGRRADKSAPRRLSTGVITGADGVETEIVQWTMPDGRIGAVTCDALMNASGVMVLEKLGDGRVKLSSYAGGARHDH